MPLKRDEIVERVDGAQLRRVDQVDPDPPAEKMKNLVGT
jgi:hypothetical protein